MSEIEERQEEKWRALARYLQQTYFKPDLDALQVAMSAVRAHFHRDDPPVWLFIQGPSGAGKTAIAIDVISTFGPQEDSGQFIREPLPPKDSPQQHPHNFHKLDDFSEKTFISSFQVQKGKTNKSFSLLLSLGKSIVFICPDFTSFLDKDPHEQRAIMGRFRRMADGDTQKDAGNQAADQSWYGKVTLIAAVTGAIESRWSVANDLGNRMMTVLWHSAETPEEQKELAKKAAMAEKKKPEIRKEIRRLAREFVAGAESEASISSSQGDVIAALTLISMRTRRTVTRAMSKGGEIIGVGEIEMPTRLALGMSQIAKAHAELFGRTVVAEEDMRIARRMGLDTIPSTRRKILEALNLIGQTDYSEIREQTRFPITSIHYHIQELAALDMVEMGGGGDQPRWVVWNQDFLKLWKEAGLVN